MKMTNPNRKIRIAKVTINIGCGESGEKLERAKKLLETLTKRKVAITTTHGRTTFGMAKGRPIGVKVTLRGAAALDFLKKALSSRDFKLPSKCFDKQGNFAFGVREHIDMPGVRYDPDIGIFGMDVCVTLERPGFSVSRKSIRHVIGKNHRIKSEDAIDWVSKNLGVKVE
ncbi:MAG: 50S ribosomal protein L5 [Candidatus Aenigmatarchaeota archaeon]|nr:50S ribosomal protein L5 [Candidatus Aenigmarchaeota archaeon]